MEYFILCSENIIKRSIKALHGFFYFFGRKTALSLLTSAKWLVISKKKEREIERKE